MAGYPKECSEDLNKTSSDEIELDTYEHDLQFKTVKELIDECVVLKSQVLCQQKIVGDLEAEKEKWMKDNQTIANEKAAEVSKNQALTEDNKELAAKVENLTCKLEEREQSYYAERVKRLEEETEEIKKKLEGEIRSISCDRKKDADAFKQELEECKKQVQQAQETMFQPILGILQRQQELLRRENQYLEKARMLADDEHHYEEIEPMPPPQDTATTRQKEPSHPKINNTVHGQNVTINQHFPQENALPAAHSLAKENSTKPSPNDDLPADNQRTKTPVQSTDAKKTAPVSSDGAVKPLSRIHDPLPNRFPEHQPNTSRTSRPASGSSLTRHRPRLSSAPNRFKHLSL